jgi:hypothetical protein
MSPSWPRTFRSAWQTLVDWSAHPPMSNGPAGSGGRHSKAGLQRMITPAGPSGGCALGGGTSQAPPPSRTPNARQPAATAPPGPLTVTRQRVVLLPQARTEPTNTRPTDRRAERATGTNQDDSPRPPPVQNGGITPMIAANTQCHDAELALKMALPSYDRWLVAGGEDTWCTAMMHAYHAHEALQEASRAITMLIKTFRGEAAALITTPAPGTDIPCPAPEP